jgi:MoxR-like ATPase
MPSDITGTEVIQEDRSTGERGFRFLQGPIFRNIVLADEINRTPPKTQAALLEAMQERQVTIGGTATRAARAVLRPRDSEPDRAGRDLPLPEAQQDRFMFKVFVDYPTWRKSSRS